ncbi:MAG: hypothetical protein M3N38_11805 [Pseudomonadota bacterium]|nr:hypothetical protein [Pseudomonadota bacterium]
MGPIMCLYGYNDYRSCEDEPAPAPAPSYVEPEPADPLQEYRARYAAALASLQGLVDGLQDVVAVEPQSMDDMSAHLSMIYTGAAYRLDSIAAARNHTATVTMDADASTAWQSERIRELQASIATAAERKAAALADGAALALERRQLEIIKASLEIHRADLAARADQSAFRVAEWLAVAGVPDSPPPAMPPERQRPVAGEYLPAHLFETGQVPVLLVPDLPRLPAAAAGGSVEFRAPPAGTVDELLTAVENMAPQIRADAQALAEESPAAAQAEAAADALAIALRTTTQLYRDTEGEVHEASSRAERTREIIAFARQDCQTAALNMLREAVEVTLLNRLARDARAAVTEFLTINGEAETIAGLTDEKVAALYRAGQAALHLPVGTQFDGMDQFLETQQKILGYVKNPLESAITAGNALGSGDPNAGTEEALAVFRGLRRDALEIAETASKELPAGAREVAMRLLDDAD